MRKSYVKMQVWLKFKSKKKVLLIFIFQIHTSSLHSVEVCPQLCLQLKSPLLSKLLTEGSLSMQRAEHTRAADSLTLASAELSDPLSDHNTHFFSTLWLKLYIQALWILSLCDV